MITIKRTEYVEGAQYLEYLCYVDGELIHKEVVNNLLRYQTLPVIAPTGKDILVKERVYYSDVDYQETEKIIPYRVGNIHRNSTADIHPVTMTTSGTSVTSSYDGKLSVNSAELHLVKKSRVAPSISTSADKTMSTAVTTTYDVVSWVDTDFGDTGMSNVELDPFTHARFTNTDDIPSTLPAGTSSRLPYVFATGTSCELYTIGGRLITTIPPSGGKVTIPGKYLKFDQKIVVKIVKPGTDISRVVTIVDTEVRDGEVSLGATSMAKLVNELKVLPYGDISPLDSEWYYESDGVKDPGNMTKLRLDGYETYDDIILSPEDKALHRFTGTNMVSTLTKSFTDDTIQEDCRFIHRRSDEKYFVATPTRILVYNYKLYPTNYGDAVIRYATGGYFFSSSRIYYIEGDIIASKPLPSNLVTYIPTYTQYGFIHFIATNDTPAGLPKHNAMDIRTLTLLPLGEPDSTITLLTDRTVTHTCTGLDGEPLIVADNIIFRYNIATKKYTRSITVPGALVAFYRLDDYIIIKTGDGRHYKFVTPS